MKDRGDDEQFKELLQNLWEETLFNEKVGNAFQSIVHLQFFH
jgi:hypothetical protein